MKSKAFTIPFRALIILLVISWMIGATLSAQSALWNNRLNGSGDNSDRYNAVIGDGAGNFYLTGYTMNPGAGKDFLTAKLNAAGDTLWTRKFNYADFDDEANFIAIDGVGNVTVSGYSDGGSTSTKNDILTIQYNSAGTLLWSARYNNAVTNEDEFPEAIAVDASNNIFIAGRSDHDALNVDDYITLKYNAAGLLQWVTNYDAGFIDRAAGVAADNAGGCIVTGRSNNGLNDDIVTISYSSTGTTNWTATASGPGGDDRGQAIARDAAGNVYMAGIRNNGSDDDFYTAKYNNLGVLQWQKIVDGGDNDRITTLKIDGAANVYITGETDAATGGSTDYDFETIKYNTSGVVQWTRITGNPVGDEDVPSDIYIDATGNVYVTGKSDAIGGGNVDEEIMTVKYSAAGIQQWLGFYNGTVALAEDLPSSVITDATGNVWVSGGVEFAATQKDAVFLKYNSTGVLSATKTFNGRGDFTDIPHAICSDALNNIYITGYTIGEARQRDVFVQKINAAGSTLWTATYNGTNENDEGLAITADAAGNVYVAGYSNGSGTFDDALLLKYNASGVLQWSVVYNDIANQIDKWVAITVSGAGDIFVTGYSDSNPSALITNYDYITIKYSSLGLQQWVSRFNGAANGSDRPAKIALLGNRIYVTGESSNGLNNDLVSVKYDLGGNLIAQKTYAGAGAGNEEPNDMTVVGNAIYITGSEFVAGHMDDYLTIKYDTLFTQLWKANYNGTGHAIDMANSISVSGSNVYVTGESAGAASLKDIALIRYNANTGAQNWAKRYTGAGAFDDEGNSVVTDAIGNIYTTGSSANAATVADYITLNYNTAGTKLLTLKYNGTGNNDDVGKRAVLDNNGYLYVTGYSKGTGNASYDFTTIKYCTPLPDAIITAGGVTTFCIGDSVVLTANAGTGLTYQWKKGNANLAGATNINYSAKTSGAYKVVVANANGCTKTSNSISCSAIGCRDIETDINAPLAEIMPNPFTDVAILKLKDFSSMVQLRIYDVTGQLILTQDMAEGTESVTIGSELVPGAYMVWVGNDTFSQSLQLIKIN